MASPIDRYEFEQAPGGCDGQGSLACGSLWGHKELDTTEQLNWTDSVIKRTELRLYSEGQGSLVLVCCSPWDCKELHMTEQLYNNSKGRVFLLYPFFKDMTKTASKVVPLCIPSSNGWAFQLSIPWSVLVIFSIFNVSCPTWNLSFGAPKSLQMVTADME